MDMKKQIIWTDWKISSLHNHYKYISKYLVQWSSSSNWVGIILNCWKKYSWSCNFISFTSKWYSPFSFLSANNLRIQNLFLYLLMSRVHLRSLILIRKSSNEKNLRLRFKAAIQYLFIFFTSILRGFYEVENDFAFWRKNSGRGEYLPRLHYS